MKKLVSVLLAVLMLLSLAACGKKSVKEQLIGSWRGDSGFASLTMTLYDDGTCDLGTGDADDELQCKWRVVDNEQLELSNEDGELLTFIIVDLDEDSLTVSMEGLEEETGTFYRVVE